MASKSSDRIRQSWRSAFDLIRGKMSSSAASNEVKRYRIVVLGDGGVGKSALTLQYVQHNFIDYHDPTIEDAYQQRTVIDSEPCLLDILDTAGQVEFTAMREQYMRGGEGFIICYSITDRHSFMEAEEYRNLILKVSILFAFLGILRAIYLDIGNNNCCQFFKKV